MRRWGLRRQGLAFRGTDLWEAPGCRRRRSRALNETEFLLPHSREASALARRLTAEHARPLLPGMRGEHLVLMVSELVSNAVRHSDPMPDGTVGLRFEHSDDTLVVAVTDGGAHLVPEGLPFHSREIGHFGLYLVDRYADGWGFSLDGVKGVWFVMNLDGGSAREG